MIFLCSEGSHESSSVDGNVTQSILHFTPSMNHLGRMLRCSASNPLVPHTDLTSEWHLNISCELTLLQCCTSFSQREWRSFKPIRIYLTLGVVCSVLLLVTEQSALMIIILTWQDYKIQTNELTFTFLTLIPLKLWRFFCANFRIQKKET